MSTAAETSPPASVPLRYSIASCSEHSGQYVAENILYDKPTDQASRWSGAHQSAQTRQWILLRLDKPAILTSVTFGKYHKQHPCNTKDLQVYAGPSEGTLIDVYRGSLRNDAAPETFPTPNVNSVGVPFPTRFVKIVPLSAHGTSFHTSIWHVGLHGIADEAHVEHINTSYEQYCETSAMRHVLKYLRQRRLLPAVSALLGSTSTPTLLEHPLVTELHDAFVVNGDYSRAERVLSALANAGLFSVHLSSLAPRARWTRLSNMDADGDAVPARGGHAMCAAPAASSAGNAIYLHGGFDGAESLGDLWRYTPRTDTWTCLSDTFGDSTTHGPCARSCHKLAWDATEGCVYLLGGLGDADAQRAAAAVESAEADEGIVEAAEQGAGAALPEGPPGGPPCEVWKLHTQGVMVGQWERVSGETTDPSGPPVLFDHQVAVDQTSRTMYVHGGRVLGGTRGGAVRHSGLFACDLRTGAWISLPPVRTTGNAHPIPARYNHAMALDSQTRKLFILGGQQDDKPLADLWSYDVDTHAASELVHNIGAVGGPPCFSARAVANPDRGELYVFSALAREQRQTVVTDGGAACWVHRYAGDREAPNATWTQVLPIIHDNEGSPPSRLMDEDDDEEIPVPRYAHQVVYEDVSGTVYMHGGNAGPAPGTTASEEADEVRLDDFWKMTLERPAPVDVVRKAKFELRKQQFRELCTHTAATSPVRALQFLRSDVYSVVDHSSAAEAASFRELLVHLLGAPPPTPASVAESSSSSSSESTEKVGGQVFAARTEVFQALLEYVDEEAREPKTDLVQLIVREG